jgi:hypothetical protein
VEPHLAQQYLGGIKNGKEIMNVLIDEALEKATYIPYQLYPTFSAISNSQIQFLSQQSNKLTCLEACAMICSKEVQLLGFRLCHLKFIACLPLKMIITVTIYNSLHGIRCNRSNQHHDNHLFQKFTNSLDLKATNAAGFK